MFRLAHKNPSLHLLLATLFVGTGVAWSQVRSTSSAPRVVVQTGSRPQAPAYGAAVPSRMLYPWKTLVTCTVFWIGELPSDRNPTPNTKSSWDQEWTKNFGGYDDPDPANRIANYATGEYRPKSFVPKLNPFYVALPYNDVLGYGAHKPEASRVIPWFARMRPEPGQTVCKGRWLQIYNGSRSCYAQWEDCGPWVTDDYEFVFGNKPPKTRQNGSAGIDISPAVRDYLNLRSGLKVHWRFVEASQVPYGPWKKYGQQTQAQAQMQATSSKDLATQQKSLEYLRKLRDEQFQKKSLNEIQQ